MNTFQIKSRLNRTARSPYKRANRITATRKKNRNGFSFSEGFIRRMTEPLTFTFGTLTQDMIKKYRTPLSEDEEFELFIASQRQTHTTL
jgi:hypothetical protein